MLDESLWEQAATFHGHKCPGLAIGFKACEGAIAELGLDGSHLPGVDEGLVCVSAVDTCPVDAARFLLGCTEDRGNLVIRLGRDMAFSFFAPAAGKRVRLVLTASRPESMSRADYIAYLLEHPYDELFSVGEPGFEPADLDLLGADLP